MPQDVGKRLPRQLKSCPECGGLAEVARNGDWRCVAYEKDEAVEVLVCGARGVSIEEDLCVTRSGNGIWKYYLEDNEETS